MKNTNSLPCTAFMLLAACCIGCEPVTTVTSNTPPDSGSSSSEQIEKLNIELQDLSTQLEELKLDNGKLQTRLTQSEENYNHLLGKYTTLVDDIKSASDAATESFDRLRNITDSAAKIICDSTVTEDTNPEPAAEAGALESEPIQDDAAAVIVEESEPGEIENPDAPGSDDQNN